MQSIKRLLYCLALLVLGSCSLAAYGQFDPSASIIGHRVWVDTNANGQRDSGEPPLPNVVVNLYFDHNNDGLPERVVDTTKSSRTGEFLFRVSQPGLYSVGVDNLSLPQTHYRLTKAHNGASQSDSDVDPGSLRTKVINVSGLNEDHRGVADIGVLKGNGTLKFEGKHRVDREQVIQRWVYQDIVFHISDNGQPVTEKTHEIVGKWMRWYADADKISQALYARNDFLRQTRYGQNVETWRKGRRLLVTRAGVGSLGGGERSSSGTPPSWLWDEPDNIENHLLMFYEMNRGVNALWRSRAIWPTNSAFSLPYGVSDIAIRTPHMMTAWIMYRLGGIDALFEHKNNNWQPGNAIDNLRLWEKMHIANIEEVFPGFENVKSIPLSNPETGEQIRLRLGTLQGGILLDIGIEMGQDTLAEILHNLTQKPVAGSLRQSLSDFSDAVIDATNGMYSDMLMNRWKIPASYSDTRGIDSGEFTPNTTYKWDFAPHGISDSDLLNGYSLFSERTTKGIVKIDDFSLNSAGPFFYDNRTEMEDRSFIQFDRRTKLAHQVVNGKWKVRLSMRQYHPSIRAEGKPISPIQEPKKQSHIAEVLEFDVDVKDSMLNIELASSGSKPHLFSMTLDLQMPSMGWSQLMFNHSKKCLDNKGQTREGAPYWQWSCADRQNTNFRFESMGEGLWRVRSQRSGKCMDVRGQSNNGFRMQQKSCNSNISQKWKLIDKGNENYSLVSAFNNKCLDVSRVSHENKAYFHQWDCHGGGNQVFKFILSK